MRLHKFVSDRGEGWSALRHMAQGPALLSMSTLVALLSGCAGSAPGLVQGPFVAQPVSAPLYIERTVNGAIFQPHMTASLFSGERRAQAIGDTLKVDIAESVQATQKQSSDTSRDNKIAVKGPGKGAKSGGFFEALLNADANASSADSFTGQGKTQSSTDFTAHLAVTVINVLPNGHLLVAGERRTGLNGGISNLRFSGIVDPGDIRAGNLVSSRDVANASLESVGTGELSDAASRSWLQRVLARSLAVW